MAAALLSPTVAILVLIYLAMPLWIYTDARRRYEEGIGCLWALMAVATGPLALIAYLIVRPPEEHPDAEGSLTAIGRTCSECGLENPWNARFCAACGKPLGSSRQRVSRLDGDTATCGLCGATVPRATYCTRCGEELDGGGPQA